MRLPTQKRRWIYTKVPFCKYQNGFLAINRMLDCVVASTCTELPTTSVPLPGVNSNTLIGGRDPSVHWREPQVVAKPMPRWPPCARLRENTIVDERRRDDFVRECGQLGNLKKLASYKMYYNVTKL
jgi:hypothetical protein